MSASDAPTGAILQRDQQTYAIVPRTPVGLISPEVLEALNLVVKKYAVPIVKITSGQRLALVGVKAETLFALAVNSLNQVTTYVSTFLLGTLFSFLIMLDFPKLRARTISLRDSRLRDIYDVTARSVVRLSLNTV